VSIAYVDGASDYASFGVGQVTIPADVAPGDFMVVFGLVNGNGVVPADIAVPSTGTALSPLGAPQGNTPAGALIGAWGAFAKAADAGATVRCTNVSGNTGTGVALVAYSGAAASQPDVIASGSDGNDATWNAPSAVTVTAGDWAVWFAGYIGFLVLSANPGTLRLTGSPMQVADGNGPAGSAGTRIGGAGYAWGNSDNAAPTGYTIGLKPAAAPATAAIRGCSPVPAIMTTM
jgi:hypothetical protein